MSSHTLKVNNMNEFFNIKTREDLANFLELPNRKLTYILYVQKVNSYYKSFEIPKKNGGVRVINAPQGDLKELQRKLATKLYEHQERCLINANVVKKVSHGFEKNRGIITNAVVHKNKKIVMNLDIENFFESFHFGRVAGYFEKNRDLLLPREIAIIIAQLTCFNGSLPQGSPCSPIITNLICNILDIRMIKLAQRYRVDYTRYADDLTFSTNDMHFVHNYDIFYLRVKEIIESFGLSLNEKKTRLLFNNSRQEVTGIVVNNHINVKREYYKNTRSMANHLYRYGKYEVGEETGSILQLEGRFSFINQIDHYKNKLDKKKHGLWTLNSREVQYQKFLFFKYFYANSKPLLVTEGKTDIIYLKSALKKFYKNYPNLIEEKNGVFNFKISFLRRTKRLEYFLGIALDGADTMKNIYCFYTGKDNFPNLLEYFLKMSEVNYKNPVILIYDNEQVTNRPLKAFLSIPANKEIMLNNNNLSTNIRNNLYILTNPILNGANECEIEDLFDKEVLSIERDGKKFSRDKKIDTNKFYGKSVFSEYILKEYSTINFENFIPMLDELNTIVATKFG